MKSVFVIGGGPAGLFAAQKIALAGHQVVVFNRDIKPGGLAEYGIYPSKDKMKIGLRKQFTKILNLPNVHYYGHAPVGARYAIPLDELHQFHPSALVFAVGAQGTKRLNLPGEQCAGVYSAKDFVYHYNLLPPYASQDFSIGRRVAIVGMGNVMVDIARWLLLDDPQHKAEEVIVVARRGPFEAKFDRKEFAHIENFLDRRAFQEELHRVDARLQAVGQDISRLADATFPILAKPREQTTGPRLRFHFLSSPQAIHPDAGGRIQRLEVADNLLIEENGSIAARPAGSSAELEVDTMIFAIGDSADPAVGLPYRGDGYVTGLDSGDPQRAAYELFDPQSGAPLPGCFVVGWARKASEGLVGLARHDAEIGANHVLNYLESLAGNGALSPQDLAVHLARRSLHLVDKTDLECLARAEEQQAQQRGLASFKFADDQAMLSAIAQEKAGS